MMFNLSNILLYVVLGLAYYYFSSEYGYSFELKLNEMLELITENINKAGEYY